MCLDRALRAPRRETETERERQRQTESERQRQADRQRQIDRQIYALKKLQSMFPEDCRRFQQFIEVAFYQSGNNCLL